MPPVLQKPRCAEPASWTAMNFWCGFCATCCLLFGTSLIRACLVTTPRLGGSSMMDGETEKSSAGRMGKVIAIALKIGAITNLTSTFLRQPATPHGREMPPPCFPNFHSGHDAGRDGDSGGNSSRTAPGKAQCVKIKCVKIKCVTIKCVTIMRAHTGSRVLRLLQQTSPATSYPKCIKTRSHP